MNFSFLPSTTLAALLFFNACSLQTTPPEQVVPEQDTTLQKTIIAFGDSLTAGYELPAADSYPAQLEQKIHAAGYTDYRVLNMGVSGDTTDGGLRRVDWALSQNPKILILALGANDGLRGEDTKKIKSNLEEMIKKFTAAGVPVLLTGMKLPRNLGPEYIAAFEKIYPDLATKFHLPFLPFLLENVALQPELIRADGLHPNAAGYAIVADNVWKYLEPLLQKN